MVHVLFFPPVSCHVFRRVCYRLRVSSACMSSRCRPRCFVVGRIDSYAAGDLGLLLRFIVFLFLCIFDEGRISSCLLLVVPAGDFVAFLGGFEFHAIVVIIMGIFTHCGVDLQVIFTRLWVVETIFVRYLRWIFASWEKKFEAIYFEFLLVETFCEVIYSKFWPVERCIISHLQWILIVERFF